MDELRQTDTPDFDPLPQKLGAEWIFIGENGLRAGWGALLFGAIFIALETLFSYTLGQFFRSHIDPYAPLGPGIAILLEAAQLLLVLASIAIMAVLEQRKIAVYAYAGSARFSRFVYGLLWGFVAISVLIGALWKAHLLVFEGSPLHGSSAWKYAAAWAFFFLTVSIFEESLLRGYLQYTLARGIGFWWAALPLSALFGFVHRGNPGESPVGLFSAGAVGLVFCLSLWYTGSLWWAIGFHSAWDWGQSYFYGTSDSGLMVEGHLFSSHPSGALLWTGGATGPEGSLMVLPLLLIIALLMWLWWRRRAVSPFSQRPQAIAEPGSGSV